MQLDAIQSVRIKFAAVHLCLSKAMIPFSWYHRSDKRHGPFILLYHSVQTYTVFWWQSCIHRPPFIYKAYTCYYIRLILFVPDKLLIISYKSATSFFFMHVILCSILAFGIANIKMIKVISCRSDIAFN